MEDADAQEPQVPQDSASPQRAPVFGNPLTDISELQKGSQSSNDWKFGNPGFGSPLDKPEALSIRLTYPETREEIRSVRTVKIGYQVFPVELLRDSCACVRCVDPHSTQKHFQTTDIPDNISVKRLLEKPNGNIEVKWWNDIPGFPEDHVSVFPPDNFDKKSPTFLRQRSPSGYSLWNAQGIRRRFEYIDYHEYMTTDVGLHRALLRLTFDGLLLLRGVPESEESVARIANRIGVIRNTFYGRTWDVKSVPDAKNVAYTSRYLGLHMDLLYMANPPGFQFLHCLKNTASGGASIFSDAVAAAADLPAGYQERLKNTLLSYQYLNAGEHYYYEHPVIECSPGSENTPSKIQHVNYSPPFQAPFAARSENIGQVPAFLEAFRAFSQAVESPHRVLEYKLQEGECVMFDNRRVLHGRKAFDAVGGERWYKGTYVDTDVVKSRTRVLDAKHPEYKEHFWSRIGDTKLVFPPVRYHG
ncbi:hypothetical protein BJ875DRAFT_368282 [Amylocarpus encephaloides]|uniref:TauD/TfdA-like domain-containing protein n=1 Tax=Amylocarpus encephaloides TaxID=45428 RepID=A0A9P7YSH7_9HELO|nr:hypothetical protein BJ875DRAFT_368282 [Amylocarpus encephaloides]